MEFQGLEGDVLIVSTRHQEHEARNREKPTNFPETQQNGPILSSSPLLKLRGITFQSLFPLPIQAASSDSLPSSLHASKNEFSRLSHVPRRKGSASCIVQAQAWTLARTSALLLWIVASQQHFKPGRWRAVTSWFVIYVSLSPDIAW